MARKWRYDKRCTYCRRVLEPPESGSAGFTRDHVKPRCQGGEYTVPCCRACNDIKGHMTPEQWTQYRAEHPEWWKLWKGRRVRV